MDNTDIKIIKCLTANARINASDIAEKIGLSVSALIERIKKLEHSGIIKGYTAILNPHKIGQDILAIVSVGIDNTSHSQAFLEKVKNDPHVLECLVITGEYDYYMKVMAKTIHDLESVLFQIKDIIGVSRFKTNIVISTEKLKFNPDLEPIEKKKRK